MLYGPRFVVKDPSAVLDYGFDLEDWLADGDSLESSYWVVDDGLTLASYSSIGTQAIAWLSGGTAGTRYSCVCHFVTAEGREDQRTLIVSVEEP